jgi:sugar phosphate isomerase/epimerase
MDYDRLVREALRGVLKRALDEIAAHGLSLVSMQSLLFGVQGAALLGDPDARAAFARGMERAIELAGRFGIPNLVFGSPGQRRIPAGMDEPEARAQAAETFRRLGDRAAAAGTVIAMETNPVAYGANFLTTLEEAEAFVAQVDHPAVTLILDLGAMHMNGVFDTLPARAGELAPRLTHVHISEPHLAPAPDDSTDLAPLLLALRRVGYVRAVSIEMKRPEGGLAVLRGRLAALTRAVAVAA